ncbi:MULTISPECIES: hypothetical protein [Streptomyces]|uniref:hypothetical protein n=1 Tax=Streptomyces TaxID=1883 RepID=UPI001F0C7E39|nr:MULTISPECIES: hypothetical protein [Streptomyces]
MGRAVGLLGLQQREFLVPVAAPAAVLVPGQRSQQAVLRAGHVFDLGELGDLLQVHAPGRGPAQRGVVELLRPAEPLARPTLEAQGAARGLLLLDLVHPDQREFGRLERVLGRHALALAVLDQGQEPRPRVPADQVGADVRLDRPLLVALRFSRRCPTPKSAGQGLVGGSPNVTRMPSSLTVTVRPGLLRSRAQASMSSS